MAFSAQFGDELLERETSDSHPGSSNERFPTQQEDQEEKNQDEQEQDEEVQDEEHDEEEKGQEDEASRNGLFNVILDWQQQVPAPETFIVDFQYQEPPRAPSPPMCLPYDPSHLSPAMEAKVLAAMHEVVPELLLIPRKFSWGLAYGTAQDLCQFFTHPLLAEELLDKSRQFLVAHAFDWDHHHRLDPCARYGAFCQGIPFNRLSAVEVDPALLVKFPHYIQAQLSEDKMGFLDLDAAAMRMEGVPRHRAFCCMNPPFPNNRNKGDKKRPDAVALFQHAANFVTGLVLWRRRLSADLTL